MWTYYKLGNKIRKMRNIKGTRNRCQTHLGSSKKQMIETDSENKTLKQEVLKINQTIQRQKEGN